MSARRPGGSGASPERWVAAQDLPARYAVFSGTDGRWHVVPGVVFREWVHRPDSGCQAVCGHRFTPGNGAHTDPQCTACPPYGLRAAAEHPPG